MSRSLMNKSCILCLHCHLLLVSTGVGSLIIAPIRTSPSRTLWLRGRGARLLWLVVAVPCLVGSGRSLALSGVVSITLLWVAVLARGWGHVALLRVRLPLTMGHLWVPPWGPGGGVTPILLIVVGHLVVHWLACEEHKTSVISFHHMQICRSEFISFSWFYIIDNCINSNVLVSFIFQILYLLQNVLLWLTCHY